MGGGRQSQHCRSLKPYSCPRDRRGLVASIPICYIYVPVCNKSCINDPCTIVFTIFLYYSKKKKITRRPVDREVQYGVLAFVCLPVEPNALYLSYLLPQSKATRYRYLRDDSLVRDVDLSYAVIALVCHCHQSKICGLRRSLPPRSGCGI